MREVLIGFVKGSVDERTVAAKLIEKLFEREFMGGKRWDVSSAHASPVSENTFACEKIAEYDWKDINAEASAKATITITKELIKIENYGYYCAG
mmetsp:Transcript_28173/g.82793  ORF Transcript_28173/g.82793 Transcript_28173/m.82793 type:complete len:94 (-) Transcript_28173:344-625(-)|eukprot:CAMPEP_0206058018 /NCGR_PEP_ID=MMETSP1466-20131121/45699_1 /ASSEMBLY_ACC=CAM_ASM_001126 /TAXON_ID=44452 /ORGANISM="Pavlova gyrans, Strain CCMP608" /LENGTH=93 /DNA_ID=CAMNT_0053433309 /DNA_START=181 /DNA_END=462 /DNA_ORIENTATION=-